MQLFNRYWHITDAQGVVQEVRGPGVVGEQPVLAASGDAVPLYQRRRRCKTPSGIMTGNYEMTTKDGEAFFLLKYLHFHSIARNR